MFRADPAHTGAYPDTGAVTIGQLAWRFNTDDSLESSSPAVSGGLVYVGSKYRYSFETNGPGYLYAVDAATGTERWKFKAGDWVDSSPAVAGGVVYVGSSDGYLYALDAVSGADRWRFSAGGAVRSSPVVSGGLVYVGSDNGSLYALK